MSVSLFKISMSLLGTLMLTMVIRLLHTGVDGFGIKKTLLLFLIPVYPEGGPLGNHDFSPFRLRKFFLGGLEIISDRTPHGRR